MAIKIKVCGLCAIEQIIALDAMGVEYCGIIFHKASPRYGGSKLSGATVKEHPLNCVLTGVFVNELADAVVEKISGYGLNAVQLCGDESPAYCESIRPFAKVIKVIHIDEHFDPDRLAEYEGYCDLFLFDTKTNLHGGSGKKFNWEMLRPVTTATPFFLSGGIAAEDFESILRFRHPSFYGVDVNSRFEISPGEKNIAAIQTFYDQIKRI